jgi:hypothetical protein
MPPVFDENRRLGPLGIDPGAQAARREEIAVEGAFGCSQVLAR